MPSPPTLARPRLLMVGEGQWYWQEGACVRALERLGWEVQTVAWSQVTRKPQTQPGMPAYRSPWLRLQNRLQLGPALARFNRQILRCAQAWQPQVAWFYNCMPVFPNTLRTLRRQVPGIKLVQYANDDPFSRWRVNPWRHLLRGVPHHDLHFAFRRANLEQLRRHGAARVELLRSYFIQEDHFPVALEPADQQFLTDVVFVGHFEPDRRVGELDALCRTGLQVNLFGMHWPAVVPNLAPDSPLHALSRAARPVFGPEYRKAICGAKIALCFLSTLNRDTYTQRNFELPAMGAFMLSQYTEDLASLFREGVEAEYFRSPAELADKARFYSANSAARERIAKAGYRRVHADGHEVTERMRFALQCLASPAPDRLGVQRR